MAKSWSRKDLRNQQTPSSAGPSSIGGALLGAVVIVLASALLGIIVNQLSPRGIPLLPRSGSASEQTPALALPPGVTGVDAEGALAAFHAQSALFLDARPEEEYAEAHIPGAISVPPHSFEERFLDLMDEMDEGSALIVYCSGVECSDSIELAERFLEVGYSDIAVFEDGWRAWVAAGGAVAEGPEP